MTHAPTNIDQQRDERFFRAWERINLLWAVIMYMSITLTLIDTYSTQRDMLFAWSGVLIVGLLSVFCGTYHLLYLRTGWPMTTRQALLYFSLQFVILAWLMRYNISFGWLGFALAGQALGALPITQWALPLFGAFAIAAVPIGIYQQLQQGRWFALLLYMLYIAIFLGNALLLAVLFNQRFELAQTVRELRAAKQQLEEQATQAEELAALRERARLAREMHDSIGHALVAMNVKLEAAQRLYAVDAARGAAEMESIKHLVRDTMAALRRSLADLRAPLADHHDLATALHRLVEEIRTRSTMHLTYSTASDLPPLTPQTAEGLWRVAREAITNVERHANATSATLALERYNGTLILRVADNGIGINEADLRRPGHYGVVGMREHIEALDGALSIARRAEGGTLVEARVPMAHDEG